MNAETKTETIETPTADWPQQIVVLTNGFVYVGRVQLDGMWLVVRNARNIRRWGTSDGLGQLALTGPTESTRLDNCGDIRAPFASVVHLMACTQEW